MFLYTISCMQGGHTTLTFIFIIFYMTAALLQVQAGRSAGRACHPLCRLVLWAWLAKRRRTGVPENWVWVWQGHSHAV